MRHYKTSPVYSPAGFSAGLTDAIKRLRNGRPGPPTPADVPPPSVFPMTPAAREALRLNRQARREVQG